jgi:putative oxidoreductase
MENVESLTVTKTNDFAASEFLPPIFRFLLAAPFLPSGAGKIFNFEATAQGMIAEGMPFSQFFLLGAIFLELVGGFLLLLGFKARLAAAMLILFLIPATLIFHDFWTFPADKQMSETIHFLKNLGILGGLTAIVYYGAGSFSLDRFFGSKKL